MATLNTDDPLDEMRFSIDIDYEWVDGVLHLTVTVTGSDGPYTVEWEVTSGSGEFSDEDGLTTTFTPDDPGEDYTIKVTATGAGGTSGDEEIEVTAPEAEGGFLLDTLEGDLPDFAAHFAVQIAASQTQILDVERFLISDPFESGGTITVGFVDGVLDVDAISAFCGSTYYGFISKVYNAVPGGTPATIEPRFSRSGPLIWDGDGSLSGATGLVLGGTGKGAGLGIFSTCELLGAYSGLAGDSAATLYFDCASNDWDGASHGYLWSVGPIKADEFGGYDEYDEGFAGKVNFGIPTSDQYVACMRGWDVQANAVTADSDFDNTAGYACISREAGDQNDEAVIEWNGVELTPDASDDAATVPSFTDIDTFVWGGVHSARGSFAFFWPSSVIPADRARMDAFCAANHA